MCLSVPALAALAYVYTCNQRYSRVSNRVHLDIDSWILKKNSVLKLCRRELPRRSPAGDS